MIVGEIIDREARIRLKVRGPTRITRTISAVIDTGFVGWLTLPRVLIAELGLPWHSLSAGVLADGTERVFDIYEGLVLWDRRPRNIFVSQADATPLVGMSLLSDYELRMRVRQNGKVAIRRLPR